MRKSARENDGRRGRRVTYYDVAIEGVFAIARFWLEVIFHIGHCDGLFANVANPALD